MAAQRSGVPTTPLSSVSSANLLRVHSVPSSSSLMKKLNKIGPSTDPWGTLQVTGLQLDSAPLMTTLRALPFSQFSVHLTVYSSSPRFLVRSLGGFKVDTIHCTTPVYPASHAIVESYKIGQA